MTNLSSEKYINISKILLIIKQLHIFVNTFNDKEGIKGALCAELRLQLNKYLHNYEDNKKYCIAALLDPRF